MSDFDSERERDTPTITGRRINFSVRKALTGKFFKPKDSLDLEALEQSTRTITAICLTCSDSTDSKIKEMKANLSSNSNLFTHLKRRHDAKVLEEFKNSLDVARDDFQLSNPRRLGDTRRRGSSSSSSAQTLQSRFDQLIVDYIIHAMIPLQSVDDPTFKKIFSFLHIEKQGLTVMSRRSLGRRIEDLYSTQRQKIIDLLTQVDYVCTTADIWSGGRRSFLGVTAHWLDARHERRSVALACKRFKGSHTYDRIASLLDRINKDFELGILKVVATVTDNGSNFVKAFRDFGITSEDAIENEIQDENEDGWISDLDVFVRLPFHLRCAAHTLALCATSDFIKSLKNHNAYLWDLHKVCIDKCNVLWKFSARPKSAEVIFDVTGKALRRPVETRWNSLYDSLKQIMEVRLNLAEVYEKLAVPEQQILDDEDFKYVSEYMKSSEPLASALDLVQGEKTAYYGMLVPTVMALRKKLQVLRSPENESEFGTPIAEIFLDSVETRFSHFFTFDKIEGKEAAIAAMTYPKFKNKWFKCIEKSVQDELLASFQQSIAHTIQDTEEGSGPSAEAMDVDPHMEDFYDFGDEDEPMPDVSDVSSKALDIMTKYLQDKRSTMESLKDHPVINKIFCKTNTPLPSSAQVERLFSYATMTNLPKSNRMSDETFEQRVILRANSAFFAAG